MIRTDGGMRAVELTDLKLIPRNSSAQVTSSTLDTRKTIAKSKLQQKKKKIAELTSVRKNHDAGATLLVVATLVATITFQVLLNPPGGYVQGDSNNTVSNSTDKSPPPPLPGTPVFLKDLEAFYVLGSVALIASVSVILILLSKISRNKIFMKFLVWVVWFAVFCTALAFTSAFAVLYSSDDTAFKLMAFFAIAWFIILLIAIWLVLIRAIMLLVRYGNLFKGWRPNWVAKLSWPKLSRKLKMSVSIISIVPVLAILGFVTFIFIVLISHYAARFDN